MYSGETCDIVVPDLEYSQSLSGLYDPLTSELTVPAICDHFEDMVDLLKSVGNDSAVDGLRFSYEVSQTEDSDAQQFNSYASCIELNARDKPLETCMDTMNRVENQFVLFSDAQKDEVC